MHLGADGGCGQAARVLRRRLEVAIARRLAGGGIGLGGPQWDETDAAARGVGVGDVEGLVQGLAVTRAGVYERVEVGSKERHQRRTLGILVAV